MRKRHVLEDHSQAAASSSLPTFTENKNSNNNSSSNNTTATQANPALNVTPDSHPFLSNDMLRA
ncbi:hypothetical protein E2C01_071823 [Portunus trituberculatus]|uniref:Uncharacterized protein n=1 Tax=Portunus trituberculatus TaxID=210409 RepID=A0A5B7HW99_PORTR|nr:hypothetical protein [Portunus trituberculatus]